MIGCPHSVDDEPGALSDHERRTLELADEYAKACAAVQPAWQAVLRHYSTAQKRDAVAAYNLASSNARLAHRALIEHAARGNSEVGR